MAVHKKIEELIQYYNLINKGDRILVAFSGGPDSVYLALSLLELKDAYDLTLMALHVNHNIEEEAQDQADFARDFCENHDIDYYEASADIPALAREWKMSLELAGRTYRYEKLQELSRTLVCDSIALGHHINDQAETLLYRMARGTGIHGMGGIHPKHEGMIRPLLNMTKEEILSELERKGQKFNVDVSNEGTDYVRNQIRHLVLPELTKINPKASEHMGELALKMGEMLAFLKPQIEEAYEVCVKNSRIFLKEMDRYPLFMQQEIARMALIRACEQEKDLGSIHVTSLLELGKLQSGRRIHLPYGVCAVKEYDEILLFKEKEQVENSQNQKKEEVTISLEKDGMVTLDGWNGELRHKLVEKQESIVEKIYTKYFSYDKIIESVTLRTARPGDYFIMNSGGQKKKLSRYFIDAKIPKQKRSEIPLLAVGSHIIWIIGGRVSEAFKVTEETTHIIEITWIEKENKHGRT